MTDVDHGNQSAAANCDDASDSDGKVWFVRTGPYTKDELRTFAANAVLQETDCIWRRGLKGWVPVRRVMGLTASTVAPINEDGSPTAVPEWQEDHHEAPDQAVQFHEDRLPLPLAPADTEGPYDTSRYVESLGLVRRAWFHLARSLRFVDSLLVSAASLYGLSAGTGKRRWLIFLTIYVAIYLSQLFAPSALGILFLGYAYFGVIVISRAWTRNERYREDLRRDVIEGDADSLPDLRWIALASSVQLLLIFPFLFFQLHHHFGLYAVTGDAIWWTWIAFTFDGLLASSADWLQSLGVRSVDVQYSGTWESLFVVLMRLTFIYVLLHGIARLLRIRWNVSESIAALTRNPDMAIRVGRRAVPPLIAALDHPSPEVRVWACYALGEIGDPRAIGPLIGKLYDNEEKMEANSTWADRKKEARKFFLENAKHVSCMAAETLGRFWQHSEKGPVIEALSCAMRDNPIVCWDAIGSLSESQDDRAIEPLLLAMQHEIEEIRKDAVITVGDSFVCDRTLMPMLAAIEDEHPWVRAAAAKRLGKYRDNRARDAVLAASHDPAPGVRGGAVHGLCDIGDHEATARLIEMLLDEHEDVRCSAVASLGTLQDRKALKPLFDMLLHDDSTRVRECAAGALGELGDVSAIPALQHALDDIDEFVRERAAESLETLRTEAPS